VQIKPWPIYINKLSKLNNKLLRILQHKKFRSHVPTLYSEFNTIPVSTLHEQQLLILAHSESVPEIFIDYLNLNDCTYRVAPKKWDTTKWSKNRIKACQWNHIYSL